MMFPIQIQTIRDGKFSHTFLPFAVDGVERSISRSGSFTRQGHRQN